MILAKLEPLFDLTNVIYFEGKLYEQLVPGYGGIKHKYRVILAENDYDYVTIPALRKRLDRAFKRSLK